MPEQTDIKAGIETNTDSAVESFAASSPEIETPKRVESMGETLAKTAKSLWSDGRPDCGNKKPTILFFTALAQLLKKWFVDDKEAKKAAEKTGYIQKLAEDEKRIENGEIGLEESDPDKYLRMNNAMGEAIQEPDQHLKTADGVSRMFWGFNLLATMVPHVTFSNMEAMKLVRFARRDFKSRGINIEPIDYESDTQAISSLTSSFNNWRKTNPGSKFKDFLTKLADEMKAEGQLTATLEEICSRASLLADKEKPAAATEK